MLSVGRCGVARLQMKVGHMDGMHCFIDSTFILVKIKSVSLYNCRAVYKYVTALEKKRRVQSSIFHRRITVGFGVEIGPEILDAIISP